MNTTARVITFGVISGLVWSVVPGILNDLFRSIGTDVIVIVSGIFTGVLISLALKTPLQTFGRWSSVAFGPLALPVGALLFGIVLWTVQFIASKITGGAYPANPEPDPFQLGMEYALFSVVSLFAIVLFPLAVLTTFILGAVIHRHESAA